MGYYEFEIKTADESKDAVIGQLSEIGCLGIVESDAHLTAYFSDNAGITTILNGINSFKETLQRSGLDNTISFEYVFIGERDWNESWKKKFKPIDVGDNFTILPPWEQPRSGRISLIIDPGMAFGTGHHETTKTCLMLIEKISGGLLQKKRFLDFGTGTGILAIAASRLGFKHITAVDIDTLAIDAAKRNADLNNLSNIEIKEGGISAAEGTFNFISANLMSEILIQNARGIASRLDKSGIALLSGMIKGQEEDVAAAMEKEGLKIIETIYDGRWVSLAAAPA
jgi:ribosomal protein L11 methyltransferase